MKSSRIFVLSDLHGHFQLFMQMLEKIEFTQQDTLYILGDCNDRGEDSLSIYQYIFDHENIHLIKGNHEVMMRDAFLTGNDVHSGAFRLWMQNGGRKTIEDYHAYLRKKELSLHSYQNIRSYFWQRFIDFINACPNFVEIECEQSSFILIHAGINPDKPLEQQSEEECVWMREYFYMSPGIKGKTIIFGHTPTCFLHKEPHCFDIWMDPIYHDKIGLDGGLATIYAQSQLNCLCLNTMQNYVIKKNKMEEIPLILY